MRGNPWTRAEKSLVRKSARTMTSKQISALLPGRSVHGVIHAARKMGVSLRKRGPDHHRAKHTHAQWDEVMRLRTKGKRYPTIMKETGLSKGTVQHILLHYVGPL